MNGKDLQRWRQSRGLTVRHVADSLGVSPRTIEGWESKGLIPSKKRQRVMDLMKKEALHLRVSREVYLKLAERAKEKGYETPDAFADELFEKIL